MSVAQALETLLAGTGYRARQVGGTAWRIERAPVAPPPVLAGPIAAVAQDPPILVTATKQPLELLSLPASVSLVDMIEFPAGSGAVSATPDIARRVDGLAITGLGPGRNRMFLRGVADSAFGGESQSTVAVVLDEARLTYSAPDPDIRLVDVERVEILKGPQGSLYGTGALGGVYRMVSHPADLEDRALILGGGGGSVAHGGTGYSASAVANLPIVEGRAALRLVGYTALEPGWIDSGVGAGERKEANSTRVSGARAQLGVAPADGWRLDLSGMAQWLNSHDSRYTYRRDSYDRPAQLPEPHDNDLSHAAARLHGTAGSVDVTLSSGMTLHEVADMFDATIGAGGFGLADPQLLQDRRRYRLWDTELRLRGRWGAIGWLLGLSHLDANQSLSTQLTGVGAASIMLDRKRRDSHDTAAYLNLTAPVTQALSIEGGGRLYRASIADSAIISGIMSSSERDRTGVTPALALAWKPGSGHLVYLRYGSAFRQGATGLSGGAGEHALNGDELASIEAGWRQNVGGGGRVEASLWYSRWDHVQSDTLTQSGLIETAEAGDARIFGAEASLSQPLGTGWHLEAGGNLTHARLSRNVLGYELQDSRLPVVPEYTLRAILTHSFTIGSMQASARLNMRYIGPARMSFDPDLDRRMGQVMESGLDANLSDGAWTLALSARNLFGAKGRAFSYGNPLRYRLAPQYIIQDPFSLNLMASIHF